MDVGNSYESMPHTDNYHKHLKYVQDTLSNEQNMDEDDLVHNIIKKERDGEVDIEAIENQDITDQQIANIFQNEKKQV